MPRPAPPAPRLAATLGVVAAVALTASFARANDCIEAIGGEVAKKVFDDLAAAHPSDGCVLESVLTDKAELRIAWAKSGRVGEPILVVPRACVTAGAPRGQVIVVVPDSVAHSCGAAAELTREVAHRDAASARVTVTEAIEAAPIPGAAPRLSPRAIVRLASAGAVLLVATLASLFVKWRKRRRAAALAKVTTKATPGASPATPEAARAEGPSS